MLASMIRTVSILLALVMAGCAAAPERDARGNPKLERLASDPPAQVSSAPPRSLTSGDVIRFTREGMPPDKIIEILSDNARLRLSAAQLVEQNRQGVHPRVLEYIVAAEERARAADAIDSLVQREATQAWRQEEQARHNEYYRNYYNDTLRYRPPQWGWYLGTPRPHGGLYLDW